MDKKIFFMENLIKHIAPIPRRFNCNYHINTVGYIGNKIDTVNHDFSSFNFSFILSGHGSYSFEGRTWAVEAPCVITQWPGIHYTYGPESTWVELFFIYDASYAEKFKQHSLFSFDQPIWQIKSSYDIQKKLKELLLLLSNMDDESVADRVDILCESMIIDSIISQETPSLSGNETKIRRIRTFAKQNFLTDIDFETLALDSDMSPASFRRHWKNYVGIPPAKYVMRLKMREACRLLVETKYSVGRIALELNFEDPLYFSKKFHQEIGQTATEYRLINRIS
jgi:AraC-like DNA-binding protein